MTETAWVHRPVSVHFVDPTSPHITACKRVIRGKDWPRTDEAAGVTCALCWNRLKSRDHGKKPGFGPKGNAPYFRRTA